MKTDSNISISWTSVGGTRYRVQYADGDSNGGLNGGFKDIPRFIQEEMDAAPYGEASTQTYTDTFVQTGVPAARARYYRVQVVP